MRWNVSRRDTFEFRRYSRTGQFKHVIAGVEGGSIAENANTSLKVSGSLDVTGDVDFADDLIRIVFRAEEDGDSAEIVLGTFLAATPTRTRDGSLTSATVGLYSMLLVLDEDRLEQTLSVDAASDLVETARQLAAGSGIEVSAVPSDYRSTNALTFKAGTTKLEVVNELLRYAGYGSVAVNALGVAMMAPYVPPTSRPVAWTFVDGDGSMFMPAIENESDWYHTPNVVVATCSTPDAVLVKTAVNADPASPYSTVVRGRRIVRYEELSDIPSEAALQAKADLLLAQSASSVTTDTLKHTYAPFSISDRVRLAYASAGIDYHCAVQSRDMELVPGLPTTTKLRRFDG